MTCKQYQQGVIDTEWFSEVYKLYSLSEAAMNAFNHGQLDVNYALTLSRLPHKMQDTLLQLAIKLSLEDHYYCHKPVTISTMKGHSNSSENVKTASD